MLENYYVDVLSPEQAKECLSIDLESLTVHTEIQSGMMLMGADWDLQEIHELLDDPNVIIQIGGSHCIAIGHGLVAIRPNDKPLFISHNEKLLELKAAIAARRASYNENSKESAGFSRRWVADQLVDALNIAREAGDARGMAIVADKLANITGIASPHSIEISHNQTQNVSISHDRTLTIAPMPMPIDYLKDAEALIIDVEDKRKITAKAPTVED